MSPLPQSPSKSIRQGTCTEGDGLSPAYSVPNGIRDFVVTPGIAEFSLPNEKMAASKPPANATDLDFIKPLTRHYGNGKKDGSQAKRHHCSDVLPHDQQHWQRGMTQIGPNSFLGIMFRTFLPYPGGFS